jgi:hypothetical protein
MVATDFTLLGMLLSLAVTVGILIFAVVKKFKLDDGKHRALYATVIGTVVAGLIFGAIHVWLATS